jgi:hypothetical protein
MQAILEGETFWLVLRPDLFEIEDRSDAPAGP